MDCACDPDFAGPDQFLCKQTPALSVQIGCAMDPANPECSDLCFLWDPAPGLNPADNMKSNPTVNPTVTTTYKVKVKNTKNPTPSPCGGTISYEVTVYVIEMELVLYKPKVIAGNTTTPANPTNGAQTFVNLDNDDNDIYYDNAKFEQSTGGIAGGDDELIRAELRLLPVDLPDNLVKLVATQGATDIKIWTDESKSGSEYLLGTDVALSLDGGYLKKNLWIEGISAHTVQQGTKLKMTYKGNDCGTNANITVLGVENITWVGNGNSVSNNNSLDSDPNYLPPNPVPATWPSGVRVFPDARAPNYTVPLNTVQLEVTLSVAPVEPVDLYVRSFDVDDPTNNIPAGLSDPNYLAFVDPNDSPGTPVSGFYPGTGNAVTFTNHEDNRTNNTKSGVFAGQIGNSAPISFSTLASATIIFPNISMHPGDNYRAVVNGDKDFLENLENLDARDEYKIVDRFATQMGALPYEINSPLKYASPVLTVWRFLHVEGDSMDNFTDAATQNSLYRFFTNFASPTNSGNDISALFGATQSLLQTFDPTAPSAVVADLSPHISTTPSNPCIAFGRFQDGLVKVLNGPTPPGISISAPIIQHEGQGILLRAPSKLDLSGAACSFVGPIGTTFSGTAHLVNVSNTGNFTWKLKQIALNPSTATLVDFIGGKFKIINGQDVNITGANNSSQNIITNGFSLRVQLFDDDPGSSVSSLPHPPPLLAMSAYEMCYVMTRSVGYSLIPFDPNLGDHNDDYSEVKINNSMLNPTVTENDNYWGAFVLSAWQGKSTQDADGNVITAQLFVPPASNCEMSASEYEDTPFSGFTDMEGLPISSILSNENIVQGSNHSYVYCAVAKETSFDESVTVAHEIGHQFGLGHGDFIHSGTGGAQIPECCTLATMGLMFSGAVSLSNNFLIPRYQNLIRSRRSSPGF